MNRHYDTTMFRNLCQDIRAIFDHATITTDVMVGFPLESDADFQKSLEFVKEIRFEKVHVFPYSAREGTKAASMPQLPKSVKDERAHIMIEETEKIRKNFLKDEIGKIFSIIIESEKHDHHHVGYTKNYIPVHVKCSENSIGELVKVQITDSKKDYCIGELL
ncbi:Threonylcarbamoyladenosine tRNA methylthiotransferase MtaB [bioreactor metagenome]|uniref:Threonylcarbamoyladenosine tRNA methylthiotransferase MtaB n=1 Tax=bioreactor metagenome TaxID=1076179 RepID=A0A645DZ86_9ZZZZ